MANVHVTQESRSLRCDLTNLERLEKGRQLAEADAECARIDEEKARVAAQYAAHIKTATSRRHELAGAIRQGYEFRDVLCRVQFVYPDREVVVAREDTGEVIERRGMNPTELRQAERRAQGDLFPEEEKPQTEPVMLAETDPDVQAAKAAGNKDTEGQETAADATESAPAAPGATPDDPAPAVEGAGEGSAGEAASPAEAEHQRKPRSDKGKPRGPHKAGFVNTESGSVNENAGSVNTQAAPADAEPEEAPELPEETEEPAFPPPAAHSRACSVCGCDGYTSSGHANGICGKCGHREDYHLGRGGAVDPLGLGPASRPAANLDAMKDRLAGEGEASDASA
jgi:hypothetical protein